MTTTTTPPVTPAWRDAMTYAMAELSRTDFKAVADRAMGRTGSLLRRAPDNKLLIEEFLRIHGWDETERLFIEHVFKQDEANDQVYPGIWRGGRLWDDWQQAYRNRLARTHPENVLQHYVQWLREYSALPLEERLDRHLRKVIGHIESQIEEQSSH